ncbi:MAG: transketolase [Pseudomonadota bacterium]|nr:transketolase [Pseudomonadota bacterium]
MPESSVSHDMLANAIRFLAADAVQKANSGHPGMPMGMADVATVLFTKFLKIDPQNPKWPDRDRFVLSAGHGSMLQYSLHYLLGYADMTIEQIKNFRQLHSKTPGHPEYGHTLGIEATTGPLGQGLAMSIGMAIAEAALAARYGSDLVDHRTYVICGDGCLMEGVSHEAIDLAGHLRLNKLIVMWDDNHISIDGPTSLSTSMDQRKRFEAAGWRTAAVDGHDANAIEAALREAQSSDRPSFIACRTTIGFGAPHLAGSEKTHGAPLGADELAATRKNLNWPYPAFEIPAEILNVWRKAGERSRGVRLAWEAKTKPAAFLREVAGDLPAEFMGKMADYKRGLVESKPNVATRKSSEMALGIINAAIPAMLGGSADLTHSNLTLTKGQVSLAPQEFGGSYVRYGIREFGMSAAMNGIALHGGFVPYGGTFLIFSDYARGAIRLSALMGVRVVYVLTHDSIGVGEDGPTHQPVEQLASLRALPNLNVYRPADAVETAECWELALGSTATPSALALSRQNLPTLRSSSDINLCARGGYVLSEADGARDVTLLATGSEVSLAMEAAKILRDGGKRVAVVSMPCWEIFDAQDAGYRAAVLGKAPRVGVEAAIGMGWDKYIGERGAFVGMHGFGASAPGSEVYKNFNITAEAVVAAANRLIGA